LLVSSLYLFACRLLALVVLLAGRRAGRGAEAAGCCHRSAAMAAAASPAAVSARVRGARRVHKLSGVFRTDRFGSEIE
jgi:hypothetical protein